MEDPAELKAYADIVRREGRTIAKNNACNLLSYRKAGEALRAIKRGLGPRGNYMKWVAAQCPDVSQSTVNRSMRVAEIAEKIGDAAFAAFAGSVSELIEMHRPRKEPKAKGAGKDKDDRKTECDCAAHAADLRRLAIEHDQNALARWSAETGEVLDEVLIVAIRDAVRQATINGLRIASDDALAKAINATGGTSYQVCEVGAAYDVVQGLQQRGGPFAWEVARSTAANDDEKQSDDIADIVNMDPTLLHGDPVAVINREIDDILGDLELTMVEGDEAA